MSPSTHSTLHAILAPGWLVFRECETELSTLETYVKYKLCIFAIAIFLGLAPSGFGQNNATSAQDAKTAPVEVKIDNFSFSPATITVPAGTTVRWTNRDDIPHTVVSDKEIFKSKPLDTDDQFSYTFTKPGTYDYFCSIHPKMTGNVVVQ